MPKDYKYPEELKEDEYKKIAEKMKQIKDFCTCWEEPTCPRCGKKYKVKE